MFKFLKEKLKAAVSRISSAIEKEEPVAEEMQAPPQIEAKEIFTKEEESRIEVPPPPVEKEIVEEKPKKEAIPEALIGLKSLQKKGEELIEEIPGLEIQRSFYDHANW